MKEYILYPIFKLSDILLGRFLPKGFPVLLYHSVSDKNSKISVSPEKFEQQMKYLKESGYRTVDPGDLLDLKDWRKKLIITFDDGWRDNLTNAAPILSKYGLKAVLFISSLYLGKRGVFATNPLDKEAEMLDENDIMEIESFGWTISNHFLSHSTLSDLDEIEVGKEFNENKNSLIKFTKDRTGLDYVSYPHNIVNNKIIEIVKSAGGKLGFGGRRRFFYFTDDKLDIPRIEIYGSTGLIHFKLMLSPSYNYFKKLFQNSVK